MGLSNSAGTVSGMIGPYVVGDITSGLNKGYEWKEVFIIAALVHICGVTFYSAVYSNLNLRILRFTVDI